MAGSSTSYDSYNGRQEHMETCEAQTQKQISLEATKEKIYTVYGNVMNIIEELEERIQKKHGRLPMPKSSTDYYDHSEKCDDTVDEIVQVQLLAFQVIFKECDPRVKEDLRDELKVKTKHWAAVRQHYRIPRDIVDTYTDRLTAIITKGKTTHSRELLDSKSETYSFFGKDDVQNVLNSSRKATEVDAKFQNDTTLKAKGPVIRAVTDSLLKDTDNR